tara:strand:+ start:3613 stop:4044 length:432 start_codon:yes stop_codon:yes gene_type:complete
MFNFFKKKTKNLTNDKDNLLSKTTSLLIHAAKIDENFSDDEREIIKKTLLKLGIKEIELDNFINEAEFKENDSNQILDFTKEIKNASNEFKTKIVETLWQIIYSNNKEDIYESNLMRRLSGLLYLDAKTVGNIKEKVKKELSK